MKNILTTLILTLSLGASFSQVRLGSTPSEIKSEFSHVQYAFTTGQTEDGYNYAVISTDKAEVLYYFDYLNKCDMCVIIPINQGAINFYVEMYNSKYVVVSDSKWKMYSADGMAEIELIYHEDGGCYFLWK